MTETLERLSQNIISIINTVIYDNSIESKEERQIISQLVYYNEKEPLKKPVLTEDQSKNLFLKNFHPYPISTFTNEYKTDVRIYFPQCDFDDTQSVEDYDILFDIVVHKNNYLIQIDNKTYVRPHLIAQHIMKRLGKNKKRYENDTVGKLKFRSLYNIIDDNDYQCVRLVARFVDFSYSGQ